MSADINFPVWKKLVFSLIITLLLLGALEAVLRVSGFQFAAPQSGRDRMWSNKAVVQDPTLPWSWTPQPGALCNISGRPSFQYNALGFRGPLFEKVKPPGTIRIVTLGDSCTLGWGVGDNETYTFLLQNELNRLLKRRVETINGGVLGYTSAQGLHELLTRILELHPDIITISYNWNDHAPAISLRSMEYTSESAPDNELPKEDRIVRLASRASTLRTYQLVQWALAAVGQSSASAQREDPEYEVNRVPEKLRVPPHYYRKNLNEMIRVARDSGIIPVLMTQPFRSPRSSDPVKQFFARKQEEYNFEILKIAEEAGAAALDMQAVFASNGRPTQLLSGRVHPTARGHRLIAKELAETIAALPEMQKFRKPQ